MKIMAAAENYLETILILFRRNGSVRAIDIANELGYARATISIRLRDLTKEGYILVDDNGHITLTERGLSVAEGILQKHHVLANVLMLLGVSKETAYEDACKIEHHISDETFRCMTDYYNNHQ